MEDAKARGKSAKKRSEQGIPNQQLKEARQIRSWSQQYVADQIGADYYYLSRWERGTASPSPYYRQKLCKLFGKNAYELGFLQDKSVGEEPERSVESRGLNPYELKICCIPSYCLIRVSLLAEMKFLLR